MRATLILLLCACGTDRCKDGTVFLTYTLGPGAAGADNLDVTLQIGSGTAMTRNLARSGSSKSIEVDFASYPEGQSLSFTLAARSGSTVLASQTKPLVAAAGCSTLSFELDVADLAVATDLAVVTVADLTVASDASRDLGATDAAGDLESSDLEEAADAALDLTVLTPSLGSIVLADVKGTFWVDAGVALGNPGAPLVTHRFATTANFPLDTTSAQNVSGTSVLHNCSWSRYQTSSPPPAENAGSVNLSGFDTSSAVVAFDVINHTRGTIPGLSIDCLFGGSNYACTFNDGAGGIPVDRYVFPEFPSPSPTPDTNLLPGGVTETFVHRAGSSFSDDRNATLTGLPQAIHLIDVNGTPGTHTLEDLTGKLDGTQGLTLEYSCDGSALKGAGCTLGGISLLSIQTSLSRKWQPVDLTRFGTLSCIDADDGSAQHSFALTQQMIADVLGLNAVPAEALKQTLTVVLVRLKVNATVSGEHPLYEEAGRGIFALVDQP